MTFPPTSAAILTLRAFSGPPTTWSGTRMHGAPFRVARMPHPTPAGEEMAHTSVGSRPISVLRHPRGDVVVGGLLVLGPGSNLAQRPVQQIIHAASLGRAAHPARDLLGFRRDPTRRRVPLVSLDVRDDGRASLGRVLEAPKDGGDSETADDPAGDVRDSFSATYLSHSHTASAGVLMRSGCVRRLDLKRAQTLRPRSGLVGCNLSYPRLRAANRPLPRGVAECTGRPSADPAKRACR